MKTRIILSLILFSLATPGWGGVGAKNLLLRKKGHSGDVKQDVEAHGLKVKYKFVTMPWVVAAPADSTPADQRDPLLQKAKAALKASGKFDQVMDDSDGGVSRSHSFPSEAFMNYDSSRLVRFQANPMAYTADAYNWQFTNRGSLYPIHIYDTGGQSQNLVDHLFSTTSMTAGEDIHVLEAWNRRTSAAGVIVAVVDQGISLSLPDFSGNLWTNPNEVADDNADNDGNGIVDDIHGIRSYLGTVTGDCNDSSYDSHGTAVAGQIGARHDGYDAVGVCSEVSIMSLMCQGPPLWLYNVDIAVCIDYGLAHGARIFVLPNEALEEPPSWYYEIFRTAEEYGALMIISAENSYVNEDAGLRWPLAYKVTPWAQNPATGLANLIGVGFMDPDGGFTTAHGYGPNAIDMMAPAYRMSLLAGSDTPWDNSLPQCAQPTDHKMLFGGGTSFAAPLVGGAAALFKAEYPNETLMQLKARIQHAVRPSQYTAYIHNGNKLDVSNGMAWAPHVNDTGDSSSWDPVLEHYVTYGYDEFLNPRVYFNLIYVDESYFPKVGVSFRVQRYQDESGQGSNWYDVGGFDCITGAEGGIEVDVWDSLEICFSVPAPYAFPTRWRIVEYRSWQ